MPAAAAAAYAQARRLRPDYLPALAHLADLFLQQNDPDAARAALYEALRRDPGCAACHYGLGQAALSTRDYEGAARAFEQALAAAPDATSIHSALAMAYRGMGDPDRARAALDGLLEDVVVVDRRDPGRAGLPRLARHRAPRCAGTSKWTSTTSRSPP